VIATPHLLAGLLVLTLQQQTAAPTPEPETPSSALAPGVTTPPSATGNPPATGTPAVPAEGAATAPPAGAPPLPAQPSTPRITFTLPFPPERGGGEATGAAGALDYQREDYAVLTGGVKLHYQDIDLAAEMLSIDLSTKQLTAVGNVVVDQGPSRLTGASATFNLDTKTGSLKQATGAAQPGIYFSGERVDKVAEDVYVIEDGIFTSCQGEVPAWSFHVRRARIRLEDYAYVTSASMRVKAVPMLYVPYMIWPTKTDRSSGLLVPKIGNSNRRGTYVGLAYYQVLGRSWDTTLYADLYSKDYLGLGDEIRYHPSEETSGAARGYVVKDPERDDWRWKVRWDHVTRDLPLGLRGVVEYEDYSDFDFFRDFERGLVTKAKNSIYSDAFVSGNWGSQSLNVLVDRRRTFLSEVDIIELRQLPEAEYKLRPTRIGRTPLYAALDSTASYLGVDRGVVQATYPRFHLQPQLRLPLAPAPWLALTLNGGGNLTWYGDSTRFAPGENTFTGNTLTRTLPFGGAEVIGPSFSRIFDAGLGPFGKLKHILEPRFAWSYVGAFDRQDEVPIFDEIDPLSARGLNLGRISLINRVLAKPKDPAKGGGAREILSLELSRSYSFDASQPLEQGLGQHSALGPLRASLRSYPTPAFGLRFDADYSVLFEQLTGMQVSGNFALGRQRFDLTWTPRWQDTTGKVLSNQGTFGATLSPFRSGHLNLSSYVTYDFEKNLLRDQRHLITWIGSCYALHLELHESAIANLRRRDWLFSVDLKNVGTFIDLNGGETTGL
jgi:LPS-assembly protein